MEEAWDCKTLKYEQSYSNKQHALRKSRNWYFCCSHILDFYELWMGLTNKLSKALTQLCDEKFQFGKIICKICAYILRSSFLFRSAGILRRVKKLNRPVGRVGPLNSPLIPHTIKSSHTPLKIIWLRAAGQVLRFICPLPLLMGLSATHSISFLPLNF